MPKKEVALIAAVAMNNTIGKGGTLPWKLPCDWAFFCTATQQQVLIVGRRSFQEFNAPVPNRHTIVVSQSWSTLGRPKSLVSDQDIEVACSLRHALALAHTLPKYAQCHSAFIGGGQQLYAEALDQRAADTFYLTRVHKVVDGDRFFPSDWSNAFSRLTYARTATSRDTTVSIQKWKR